METTSQTPNWLVFARHLVLMCLFSLLNPLIWFDSDGFAMWAATLLGALILAAILYGLMALFFTARAKKKGIKGFIVTAWVMVALQVAAPWLERNAAKAPVQSPAQQFSDHSAPTPKRTFTDEEVGFPAQR